MRYEILALGIDIGSVTVKLTVIDNNNKVLFKIYDKHHSCPLDKLYEELLLLREELKNGESLIRVAVTGSGRDIVSKLLSIPKVNEIVAQATAASRLYEDARTIIEIGGQDSKFIRIGRTEATGDVRILTQKMNDICAAGTGAFIEQQAERMNISLEEFAKISVESKNPAFVAGRCAVFSKSDIVHLQQEGVPKSDISAGICNAVVRNYISQFSKGRKFETPIIFQGGLAANKGVIKAFKDIIKLNEEEFKVAENFEVMGAIGAAITELENTKSKSITVNELINNMYNALKIKNDVKAAVLKKERLVNDGKRIKTFPFNKSNNSNNVFLGIDVGSTSTCVAAIDDSNNLIAKCYVLNKGSLIDSVNNALRSIRETFHPGNNITVVGVGVTGSGRYLVSKLVGVDVIKDEISAQVKAAITMFPEVDTIFEIGGQDSKYIKISDGRIADFEMNKVCAAGTGSFLQEQADRLNEKMNNFSNLAFQSENACNLGSRCTVFMESDLINYQQMGVTKEDLVAGLSYAIVNNYLKKVVMGKSIGDKILFLGGVAYNESVIAAFQQVLNKKIIVPEHHEVSAAIGMALYAKETNIQGQESKFFGFENLQEEHKLSFFQCKDCSNSCRIGKVTMASEGNSFTYGGICGKYDKKKSRNKLPNLFDERNFLLQSYISKNEKAHRGSIGIPRGHLFYELFPLYCVFLQELGYNVVLSDETNTEIAISGLEKTAIDNCYASKLVYGHIQNLILKGVNKIFFPSVIEFQRRVKDLERNYSCPHIQGMPMLIRSAFPSLEIISPYFYRDKSDLDWKEELKKVGQELDTPSHIVEQAIIKAAKAQSDFRNKCEELGRNFLQSMNSNQRTCVILGKVYNVCDPKLNLNIVDKLLEMEVVPIPYDCLPISEQELDSNYIDMIWESGQNLIRAAKYIAGDKRIYPIFITNFGCGPDSFITKYMSEIFSTRSFLTLEVDEHTSDVGFYTRIEAFLNNLDTNKTSDFSKITAEFKPFIPYAGIRKTERLLFVPWGFDSYRGIEAAFSSISIRTKMLPPHDEKTEYYGKLYTSGRECLPYIMHIGDTVRMTMDPEFNPNTSAIYMPASDLSCRVSLFSTAVKLVLRDLGYPDVPVIAPRLSMDKDEILKFFGIKFARNLFRGMLGIELLTRKVPEIRPYEKNVGETDQVYQEVLTELCNSIKAGNFFDTYKNIVNRLESIKTDNSPKRPIIGLVGDDYTRGNSYANNNLIKQIEDMGGEVRMVPIWSTYFEFQMGMKPIKTLRRGQYADYLGDEVKSIVGQRDIKKVNRIFEGRLACFPDAGFSEMFDTVDKYVDDRTEPIIIMALCHVIRLINEGVHGIVNVVGFQCMIHSIVSAQLRSIFEENDNLPNLTLSYDFMEKGHQLNRLEAFMHQVHQYKKTNPMGSRRKE